MTAPALLAAAARQRRAARDGYWTVYRTRHEAILVSSADVRLLAEAWLDEHREDEDGEDDCDE